MRRNILLPAFLAAATAAHAAEDCTRWSAAVEEVEGGKAMVARVCADATPRTASLSLMCGAKGLVFVMFDDGGTGEPPGGDMEYHAPFRFEAGGEGLMVEMSYMAMDGVMFAEAPLAGPLLALLKRQGSVTVGPTAGETASQTVAAPAQRTFTLSGSTAALAALARECR